MNEQRNIIFDLGGVIFEHNPLADLASHQKFFSPIEEGVALLEECHKVAQKSGHKLYVCSNWSMGYVDMLEQDFPQIFKMFDGIVTPTVAQAKKPDTKIFRYLLDRYELIPHHSIFIDDQLPNVDAARSVGMSGIHLDDFMHVKSELKRLKIF